MINFEYNKKNNNYAYVWIFLPGSIHPIVAGRITRKDNLHYFTYGQSYLENKKAIPLSPFELPLQQGNQFPEGMNVIHTCLRDSAPDAWGRRVIEYRYPSLQADELDYLLLSESNRIGALDFQLSSDQYQMRESKRATLEELLQVATFVELAKPLPKELEFALLRGTSVGGARPKALIEGNKNEYIAKFGLTHDTFNIIKAEYIGMMLAKEVGISVPNVQLKKVLNKDVLLIERFDRKIIKDHFYTRELMLSGLSLLKLNEMEARYASYIDLADTIRQHFESPKIQLLELYKRLIFNILIGNTDDHAKNHSAFWNGISLKLTPAYDLCPQMRTGQEASQAMAIDGIQGNLSTLINVLSVSKHFQINTPHAIEMISDMINSVKNNWNKICDQAQLTKIEQQQLWGRSIFNPFCFQDWQGK